MAKSKSFLGLRRGSTKSLTFSVLDGQQITKDRVYDVKNPRTVGQMRQRMLMTTVGAAYKFMKSIADHSFEGKTSGMQCMREFNSRNLNKFKAAASADGNVAFNEYKDGAINPLPFILAAGSLPGFDYSIGEDKKLALQFTKDDADTTTAEGIYALMGVNKGDLVTFCTVIGAASLVNGVLDYNPDRFDVVRLYCDKSGAVSSIADAFTISTNNLNASVEFAAIANGITIKSIECNFGAVIQSRKSDTNWLRSNAVMVVDNTILNGVKTANQLGTYPIGTDLILNNGPMQNGQSTETRPVPSLTFAQSSINATGTATVNAPKLNGIPAGSSVLYASQNPSIATVNAVTGVVQPVSNGTAIIVATTSATDEYAAGKAQFSVVVSGIVASEGFNPQTLELKKNQAKTVTLKTPIVTSDKLAFGLSNPTSDASLSGYTVSATDDTTTNPGKHTYTKISIKCSAEKTAESAALKYYPEMSSGEYYYYGKNAPMSITVVNDGNSSLQ